MQTGTLSLSEALSTGLMTTVIGLSIVFSVLIILMIVLIIMKKLMYKEPKTQISEAKPAEETKVAEPAAAQNEEELIAVLTAAIAASLNTSTYNLKIKSYKRLSSNATSWQKAGINDTVYNRL